MLLQLATRYGLHKYTCTDTKFLSRDDEIETCTTEVNIDQDRRIETMTGQQRPTQTTTHHDRRKQDRKHKDNIRPDGTKTSIAVNGRIKIIVVDDVVVVQGKEMVIGRSTWLRPGRSRRKQGRQWRRLGSLYFSIPCQLWFLTILEK